MNAPTRDLKAKVWARDALDWYREPESVTTALLKVERFLGVVWDPACGAGSIVEACHKQGVDAVGSDISDRCGEAEWFLGERDFLKDGAFNPWCPGAANIITNPPFFRAKGAEAFIRRALDIVPGKVAAFVDTRFLSGAERANSLFKDHPPARVWMVTPRVSCPPGKALAAGGKASGGTADWCWLVWDRTSPANLPTQLLWLRGVGK